MNKELYYHFIKKSTNKKTGPISILTSSYYTCPSVCPFKRNGCYADGGPLKIHWDKLTKGERGIKFSHLLIILKEFGNGQFIRLFQAGDMPGINNYINFHNTKRLVKSLSNWKAFGYTHKPLTIKNNIKAIKYCNNNNVCINLSANNLNHADKLLETGIGPVSVTLPKGFSKKVRTPKKNKVIICPAVITKEATTCSTCGGKKGPLCNRIDRDFIIGFPAHGSSINKASEIAKYGSE